jgi:peptide/nickel transport system permease protein
MKGYIARRLLIMIPTILFATVVIFSLVNLLPGDIVDAMMADSPDVRLDRAAIERTLGLDAPLIVQYGRWLGVMPGPDGRLSGIFQGNLGHSFWARKSVVELVALKWPITFQLGLMGLLVAQLIAIPVGVYSAARQDSWGDFAARSFAILCISVPGFWLATLVIVFPSIWWGYMPPLFVIRFMDDPVGNVRMFVVPAAILGMAMSGMTMRMTRTMTLEVLRQDYIRTAYAKGLREKVVVFRHALKNALIPVVSLVGLQMPVMIGGTVIIEKIFGLPGMGRLILDAVQQRDQALVSGVLFLFSIALVMINLLVDLTYSLLEPRIRYE